MYTEKIEDALSDLTKKAVEIFVKNLPSPPPALPKSDARLEIPKHPSHGDLSTNISMRLAKHIGMQPQGFALGLKEKMEKLLEGDALLRAAVEKIEVAPSGFLNFWLSRNYLYGLLSHIRKRKSAFGSSNIGGGRKVLLEFVSANPTGPLTVAHGRQAAVGDALSNILTFSNYGVSKEFYVNDEGKQIDLLGLSLRARYKAEFGVEEKIPEDGYIGGYLVEIAKELKSRYGKRFLNKYTSKDIRFFSKFAVRCILKNIKSDLRNFGIKFDTWFCQSSLTTKKINRAIEILEKKNHIYKKDGATWFRSTQFGDDKDRVIIKSDGSYTYLAPDIAYHLNKYRRGYSILVNIWGPDHHGYISRLKASTRALGFEEDSIVVLLVQLATLYRNGKILSMSTRKGEFITLKEIVDEVGKDVARFFFLTRKLDSHLDFDLEVAKKNSKDNPVYYIQYAHARIWSILDYSNRRPKTYHTKGVRVSLLKEPEEILLLRKLAQFPIAVEAACATLEPCRIIDYLTELASIFHNFYTQHRVVSEDSALTAARLFLVEGVKVALANGLKLVGVSLPKRM